MLLRSNKENRIIHKITVYKGWKCAISILNKITL